MTRLCDLTEVLEEEKNEDLTAAGESDRLLYSVDGPLSETKKTKVLIKKARNKRLLQSMEEPFDDDQDIMQYLDRAIDRARSPLDELELKMLHDSLCQEIQKERAQKKAKKS